MQLYASKFDMVRLDTCLDGMGGFQDLRMYIDVPTQYFRSSTFASMFIMHISFPMFVIPFYIIVVGTIFKFHMELQIHPSQIYFIDPTQLAVNGENVEMFSFCARMHRNLTWLD